MLKNIDPVLNGELLYALRYMGHGDEMVLADANFPADTIARDTTVGVPIRLDGVDLISAAKAILSVLPLDSFVDAPVHHMQVVGEPGTLLEVHKEFQQTLQQCSDRAWPLGSLERYDFYARSRNAYVIVQTGERRSYADFLLTKGVIGVDGHVL